MHLVNFYLNISTAPICSVFVHVKVIEISHDNLVFCKDVTRPRVGQLSVRKRRNKKKSRIFVALNPREAKEKLLLPPVLPTSPGGL